ncbi:hypothetical protein [Streptomyces malaysiense]|uniref:Uncharacterized protein n=1 Tax=Streptomyces malaysiense TaxID=1428626 RepID=A0A1J4PTU6_9ACTN|nr:hypothetical protein [Streptomyces malaysiense]OIK23740.1 hypothetical protein VT52_030950 [Streptomyces malaysiense]
MIAVVGHPDLTVPTLALLEEELRSRLAGRARAGRAGLVRAGRGLPVAFGRAAHKAGLALVTVLPSRGGMPGHVAGPDRDAAGELLLLSRMVRLVEYDPADRASCIIADEALVRSCARVLAVWDGSPSNGRDATAHLVAYARSHGVDVEVLWPRGAEHRTVPSAKAPGARGLTGRFPRTTD